MLFRIYFPEINPGIIKDMLKMDNLKREISYLQNTRAGWFYFAPFSDSIRFVFNLSQKNPGIQLHSAVFYFSRKLTFQLNPYLIKKLFNRKDISNKHAMVTNK